MQDSKAPLIYHLEAVAAGGASCLSWPALLAWEDELFSHGSIFLSCVWMGCHACTPGGVSSRTGSYWQVKKQIFEIF